MGILSNELKAIKGHMNDAKNVINAKYQEVNKNTINTLTTGELAERIEEIPALDTSDATATPQCILKDKTAYIKGCKETGVIQDYSGESNSQEINITKGDTNAFTCNISKNGYMDTNTKLLLPISELKQQGLTPDIIVKGKSFYGIQGTGETGTNTNDANATSSDIAKNKTAYVNGKKVTGTLYDYHDYIVGITPAVDGKWLNIKLPDRGIYDETSVISVSFDKIASLIGLKSDIIKDGESVLGIKGTYSKPPDITDGVYYDFSKSDFNFNYLFKWGFLELANENAIDKLQLYQRMYNVYYINGDCDGYYLNGDKETIYAPTYNDSSLGEVLCCYVGDLNLTIADCNHVYHKLCYDCSELIKKFGAFYYKYKEGKLTYLLFDNFDIDTLNKYRNTCLETFNEICGIIRDTYGISWKGGSKYLDSVGISEYTVTQKVKIAKVIHDFLVLNNTYSHSSIEYLDQTMYPALSKGKYTPVCASYAHAFQWCCQKFGIFAITVLGTAGENHMWSMVCYEPYYCSDKRAHNNPSVWNEMDVTWDDPTGVNICRWKFFNVTSAYLKTDDGGNRERSVVGVTDHGIEAYDSYISNCSCTKYKYSGTTKYGGL